MSERVIKVSRDQIQSAKWLIELHGGDESKVSPLIRKIAHARKPGSGEAAVQAS
ncbi:MAG: hypothetical protein ABI131_00235 [Nostocoides sp.]